VFMGSMADAWLTEGMADYSAITYLKDSWGDEQAQYFWLDDAAFLLDYYRQGGRDHALVPVDSAGMEPVIYYLKGAWVLRMLQWVIGEGPMGAALRSYREAHPFSAATTQDFVDAAEAAGGEDLGWFFGQWLYGTGVMSLGETHRDAGGDVEVTVSQHTPWSAHPERFFQMPLTIRIESGEKSTDHLVTVSGAESTCVLEKP
jgi:aminopeptidase N